ncbi:hypothetical protein, variant [Aphanomyces invadans]|uniref:Peptidase A1 domain-containing protein n=1 Tax=Aphanomyces invadans TaxID=157072 RepID=A0A024UIX8_9STRA|nr:hypothetical protein, variant [Aphanomyces invadans]ETW06150.1 hypothetical protein, variant [Aphanomyces invadans]|eukprot:XP_008865927.1 hypothetical protein, variant [Aphanomyces invadans]
MGSADRMRAVALWTLCMMASAARAAFNVSALPPLPSRFPTYDYPSNLDLSHAFPVDVKKGRDLLLPLAPLHHVLFPAVDPGGNVSLGVSLSACAGSMYVSLVTVDNVVFPLSTSADQCYTFVKEASVLPSTLPSMCPQYHDRDGQFYTLDPYTIQGVLVMADVDDDVCVSVSFSSSLTFPTGFARMFKADASPNMTLDAPSAVMSFEAPTVVTTALNESTCDDCSYDVYFSPAQSSSAVPPVLPSMCLYASNMERKTLADSSGGHSGRILDLHRSFDEGWYHIYLIATIPGMSRPSMFVYTPTTVFLSRSIAWTSIVVICVVAVAAVGTLWLGLARHMRRKRSRFPSSPHLPVPPTPYDNSDETASLLAKTTAYHPVEDGGDSSDDDDPRFDVHGYQNIGHVTV